MFATEDGGLHWLTSTSVRLGGIPVASVTRVRFATVHDGWLFGNSLYATHDGGRSWRRISLPGLGSPTGGVVALEAADGFVNAEIQEGKDPNSNGPVQLYHAAIGGDNWTAVSGVGTPPVGYGGSITSAGGGVWATLHPGLNQGMKGILTQSSLYRSFDGRRWRILRQPCPSGSVADAAAATRSRLLIVCAGGVAAGSQDKIAFLSDDAGATFRRISDPPFDGDYSGAAASSGVLTVLSASGATWLYSSFDGGRRWQSVLTFYDGGLGLLEVGYTTRYQGVAVVGRLDFGTRLLITRDGGHHWAVVHLPTSP
jgi:photosystem II stability/assembly factor-like uncharacterized protein